MKRLAIVLLVGCSDPEVAAVKAGAKEPVHCLRKDKDSGLHFCRDADRKTFICTSDKDSRCVEMGKVKTTLDGILPEKPPSP
jgi:hypothetical protein